MRWYILRALLTKEFQRHLANRGGIALALLLVAAAVLLSVFSPPEATGGPTMVGGVQHCFVDYDSDSPIIVALVKHLQKRENQPRELVNQIHFRPLKQANTIDGVITYQTGTGALQLRPAKGTDVRPAVHVYIWHPRGDPTALAPYEAWFWKESRRAFLAQARTALEAFSAAAAASLPAEPTFDRDNDWLVLEAHRRFQDQVEAARPGKNATPLVPDIEVQRQGLGGKVLDFRAAIATGMVVFALYFACVYLMPTLNCEERERGVLLAQALSPASPTEIVAAKFLFYPMLGIGLAAILAGIYRSDVLSNPFFWLSLFAVGGGFLGIGMTVAALARTQRAAFLGAMCYLLSVSLILLVCAQNNISLISNLAIEYHGPRILHAALSDDVNQTHWVHLLIETVLAACWLVVAGWLFRRRGWQ